MRRNFAEILRSGGVDIEAEYESLSDLLFENRGLYWLMENNFRRVWFSDTAASLYDFNSRYGV